MQQKEYLDEAHEDRQESSNVDKDVRQIHKKHFQCRHTIHEHVEDVHGTCAYNF